MFITIDKRIIKRCVQKTFIASLIVFSSLYSSLNLANDKKAEEKYRQVFGNLYGKKVVVYEKTGVKIEGKLVKVNIKSIIIKTDNKKQEVKLADIKRVEVKRGKWRHVILISGIVTGFLIAILYGSGT